MGIGLITFWSFETPREFINCNTELIKSKSIFNCFKIFNWISDNPLIRVYLLFINFWHKILSNAVMAVFVSIPTFLATNSISFLNIVETKQQKNLL